jgi:hypothetical protein
MNEIIKWHRFHQTRQIPPFSLGYSTSLRVDRGLVNVFSSFLSFIFVIRRRAIPQLFYVIDAAVGEKSEFYFVI